ncbi:MAG: MBL fold metallo-hydrolase [Proteobacteria bacterium]|nr:MBL fold metallo-hydrolase [Pseudomonadota bacterium]MBU1716016.1 MBL fold metallo-hydrolase [Pseudomonadota bacterium]
MKAIYKCLLLITCLLVFNSQVSAANGLVKISDHVYSYLDTKGATPANSFGANAGIILGPNYIIVVDTLISATEAKRFIADIRKISDLPIKYVINTHYHLDHVFGNSEFAKLGATIISQESCKESMEKYAESTLKNIGAYGLTEQDMAGTTASYPEITFTDTMQFDLGKIKVEIMDIGHSHTKGSIAILIPAEKVLFAGDILFTNYHPFMIDGDIDGWEMTIDQLTTLEVDKIIPGHGPLSTKKDLQAMKDYILLFDKTATALAAGSNDFEQILAKMKKALPARAELGSIIGGNLKALYMKKP